MSPDLLALIYTLSKDFGVGLCEFGIIVFLIWKLATNHLAHVKSDLQKDVSGIGTKVDNLSKDVKECTTRLNDKINDTNNKVTSLGERIAKVEGEIEQ
jgi:peptidoglycan hydrolase CwlO-like protein